MTFLLDRAIGLATALQTCNVVNICVNNAGRCNGRCNGRFITTLQSFLFWTSVVTTLLITTLQPHRIVAVTIATLQRLDTAVAIACMRSVSRAIALAIYLCPPHPPFILPWYAFECCGTVDCHVAQITLYRTRNS